MIATTIEPLNVREEIKLLDPPSVRDRGIFEQVAVKGRSQEEVATEHSLTQARVSQIVARVRQWLMTATDDEAGDLPPEMALRLGARMVRLRLENLLTTCMEDYGKSRGKVTTWRNRETESGRVSEEITRMSWGDLRYLTHYRQVALSLARLDGVDTAPHVERPQRSIEEATAGLLAVQAAQVRVEEELEAEREQQRAAKAQALVKPAVPQNAVSELRELKEMLERLDQLDSRAGLEKGLYQNQQLQDAAQAGATGSFARSDDGQGTYAAALDRNGEAAADKVGEKKAYNSAAKPPRELTDQQRQRRREFLQAS